MQAILENIPTQPAAPVEQIYQQAIAAVPREWQAPLAVPTISLLHESLGNDAEWLLPWMSKVHRKTFIHEFRSACLAYGIAAESPSPKMNEKRTAQFVTGCFFHDIAKRDLRIRPLIDHPGYYSPDERRRMGWHAPAGERALGELAMHSWREGRIDQAAVYAFASPLAGDHHTYGLAKRYPRAGSEDMQWQWEATIALQNIDRSDAITSPPTQRAYVAARMKAEGDTSRMDIIDRYLTEDYGTARTEPLPILELSPQDINELVLWWKRDDVADPRPPQSKVQLLRPLAGPTRLYY